MQHLPKSEEEITNQSFKHYCYTDMIITIESIKGNFQNGTLHGPALITYTNSAYMEVTYKKGIIQGMIRRFDKNNIFEFIGNYHNGLPHGPFWIGNHLHQKFVLIHFYKGKLVLENVVQFDMVTLTAIQGDLVSGSFLGEESFTS